MTTRTANKTRFTISLALVTTTLAFTLSACLGGGWSPPQPDSCSTPGSGSVASLEVGSDTWRGFEAWGEEDSVNLTVGGQGGIMLPFQVQVQGDADACQYLDVRMEFIDGGLINELSYPVQLYPQEDGTLRSETHHMILDIVPWDDVLLEVTMADTTIAYTLSLN